MDPRYHGGLGHFPDIHGSRQYVRPDARSPFLPRYLRCVLLAPPALEPLRSLSTESGLFPGLNFYLTGWYKREELNKRVAIFFAGAVLAGAFGGIFGYALSQMNGVGGKEGWAWIFIMEGLREPLC